MSKPTTKVNEGVTKFLDELQHPLRKEIELLRQSILNANTELSENIKWNGPNYHVQGDDRVTMKIHPPKQIQLIFHRGAKVLEQPEHRLVNDTSGILNWKANDRAVATIKSLKDVTSMQSDLTRIVNEWIVASAK